MNAIDSYFGTLAELLQRTQTTQRDAMEHAAQRILACLASGGMLYTFGTGHGHLLALEVFYRAGGLARVCPILDEKLMLHLSAAGSTREERNESWVPKLLAKYPIAAGDVLIVISNSGRNAAPVMLAKAAKERGAFVTALTSMRHSSSVTPRNRENLHLYEATDLVLDNGGVPGDAAYQAADGTMVGPTSTVAGAAILQAIVCRIKQLSVEQGFAADFFRSSNVDGGDAWNDRLIERYRSMIPGLA